jgi:tyrosine-protein kinase Etk/Wzc
MNQTKKNNQPNNNNLFSLLTFRFIPYWPLLLVLVIFSLAAALAYLHFATPSYEASATILVKDEKKGSDDSRIMESLNIFGTKKIVENEIEVVQSRALMKEVVKNLKLYAPVFSEGSVRSSSAYTTSPIIIEAKDPENLKEEKKIYFSYDVGNKTVKIGKKIYPVNQWVTTEYGDLRFLYNNRFSKSTKDPLYFTIFSFKKIVTAHQDKLTVTPANKLSSVVNLAYKDESPERAEDILNELLNAYNRAGINDKNTLADNTLQFVDDRLKHVEFELDSVEKQIQMYRSEEGVVNLSEQSSLFLKNVGDNDQQMAKINMQVAVLDQVEKYINSGNSKSGIVPSTLGVNDPVLSNLLQRLYAAEAEYEKLKNTTAENNPMVISLINEIDRLRPTILENIRIERLSMNASRNNLNRTNQVYTEMLHSIPEKERKLLEISRQQTIINNVYNFLLQKREETALSYAATVADTRILDFAESTIKPVSPKKIIALPVALIFAIILFFVIVSVKDFVSSKILFRSDLDTLTDVPVFGELGLLRHAKTKTGINQQNEYISQQYYQIITSMGLFSRQTGKKKILITSSIAGEGKSFVSSNLAKTLARAGKKVILLDFDLKNPGIISGNGTEKLAGISEYLLGEKEIFEIIKTTGTSNLFIAGAGKVQENSTELLSNNKLEELFAFLEKSFDFILIDTSPVEPVSDAFILSQYCDSTIFVVRHGVTPKTIIQMLDQKKKFRLMKDIGIVFNGVKSRGLIKGYGYGYGYGYEYVYSSYSSGNKKSKVVI